MPPTPSCWAIVRDDAPFAHLFTDRRVPLRQPNAIQPRDETAPLCLLIAGDALSDDQVLRLAAQLYEIWAPECPSVEEAADYIRKDLPLKVTWFEAIDLGLGPISLWRSL